MDPKDGRVVSNLILQALKVKREKQKISCLFKLELFLPRASP